MHCELNKDTGAKLALVVAVGIVYALSPLDFIPDAVPIIGWLDDIGVITFVYKRIKAFKRQQRLMLSHSEPLDAPLMLSNED